MSIKFRDQIRANLNTKDTEELLEIWKSNDRLEWSDLTFELMEEELIQRGVPLPEQNEPVFEHAEEDEADDLEDWEAKLLDNEDQPELYDTLEVIDLIDNINKVAKAVVIIYVIVYLFGSPPVRTLILGGVSDMESFFAFVLTFFISVITTALQIAFVYFPLKALTHILRILMEMEFNSRTK